MKTKEEIVNSMCYTYRHDYGLRKLPSDPPWTAGMTEEDAMMLYRTMEQIYDNDISPIVEQYNKIHDGRAVVVPVDKDHAEFMIKMGMFYLDQKNDKKEKP
jgi:hypothetical protein